MIPRRRARRSALRPGKSNSVAWHVGREQGPEDQARADQVAK